MRNAEFIGFLAVNGSSPILLTLTCYYYRRYVSKERKALLSNLEKAPSHMWPTGTIWNFQNQAKIYGSPMLDDAILQSKGEPRTLASVLEGLHKPTSKKL